MSSRPVIVLRMTGQLFSNFRVSSFKVSVIDMCKFLLNMYVFSILFCHNLTLIFSVNIIEHQYSENDFDQYSRNEGVIKLMRLPAYFIDNHGF